MKIGLNPFAPNAGFRPPELVGRDAVLQQAQALIERLPRKLSVQSMLLTGVRGVGKTVLLNEIAAMAERSGVVYPILVEAEEDRSLAEILASPLRLALLKLDRVAKDKESVHLAMAAMRNFLGTMKVHFGDFGIELDRMLGLADSGDVRNDLTDLARTVAEAVTKNGRAVLLLVDEAQKLNERELGALVMSLHRMQQLALPMAVVGAGLPTLLGYAGNAKAYAERMMVFDDIGALSREDTGKAISAPLKREGVKVGAEVLDYVYERTEGYPYFIQEWGFELWNFIQQPEVTLEDVKSVDLAVTDKLDRSFFKVRTDRITGAELAMVRAMASLPGKEYKLADVAKAMDMRVGSLGPRRSLLIERGLVFSPHNGYVAFTVPRFADYLRRQSVSFAVEER